MENLIYWRKPQDVTSLSAPMSMSISSFVFVLSNDSRIVVVFGCPTSWMTCEPFVAPEEHALPCEMAMFFMSNMKLSSLLSMGRARLMMFGMLVFKSPLFPLNRMFGISC